jgi:hypothetical protein
MIKGKTTTGFEFKLYDEALDNMELVELMAEIQDSGSPMALAKVLRLLLGEKQRTALYNHLRTKDGRVPVAAVSTAFVEIVKAAKQKGKN